jgi:nucleoside-diphosphate-sugar epimerase
MLAMSGITGRPGTEEDVMPGGPRIDAENATVALAQRGVRSSVVRLPPLVHSDLDHHGFAPTLIALAREKGHAAYVEDGANRWPAVDTRDAARLYRLALESAPAGSRLHAVGDDGIQFRDIAATIGAKLGAPAISVTEEDAPEHLSFLAAFAHLDNPTSSALTRELLGWEPTHPGLIADLENGHYFA